ncbi:potassium channel subfamily K member 15 [Nematostella vectensis]|uniref:potassium channel subfamily K member 15 n=1 Tax=Nematostella vectensis TaxID=45351 RepID=UPI00138FD7AB|nr:potassium channel subfamily K member 15 [Nematostella vectensis]
MSFSSAINLKIFLKTSRYRVCRKHYNTMAMKRLWKTWFIRMGLFYSYGFLGGLMFKLVEEKEETNATISERLLADLNFTLLNETNITLNASQFEHFVREAGRAVDIKRRRYWDYRTACEFTFAAILTVGRGLTIPYCLIGLALTAMSLKTSGDLGLHLISTATAFIHRKVYGAPTPPCPLRRLLFVSIMLMTGFLCLMSVVGVYLDKWSFLDSLYCWFITFTTIGFGDFVPFDNYRQQTGSTRQSLFFWNTLLAIPYIFGFCLVSLLINVLVECSEKGFVDVICSARTSGMSTERQLGLSREGDTGDWMRCRRYSV